MCDQGRATRKDGVIFARVIFTTNFSLFHFQSNENANKFGRGSGLAVAQCSGKAAALQTILGVFELVLGRHREYVIRHF